MSASFRDNAEFTAAQMYYIQNRTMEHIAQELGISRSTVSRLLREARDQGIVRISVHPPTDRVSALEHRIRQLYGVSAHVAQSGVRDSAVARADATAVLAAGVVDQLMQPNTIVGLAWGATMTSVVRRLPVREVQGIQTVQLNGAVNSQPEFMDSPSGINFGMGVVEHFAQAYGGRAHLFAVPAFFDYEQTKQVLWRERSTHRILNMQRRASVAVFGVGTFSGGTPSQVYSEGYLSREDLDQLNAEEAVGDVCTVFLRADGSWRDIELNSRCSVMPPDVLGRIPRRVCVVNGPHKVTALRGALEAGLVTDLVLDQASANALTQGR
ncbi:MarR family transcriptional regulator [Nesterenkonia salmonea]|uniref:MarR family transcriptional regulator n=1 Tax=Nesterenkonia salmonea TaxID=1804987 RepID=A0A5R9B835_9MICC|nr:sugar-binding domain-containing protein [Nesterenkonia salmonea]TLP93855.1 MarR family transcriptional regulator [Nesterenkonia salmonea]